MGRAADLISASVCGVRVNAYTSCILPPSAVSTRLPPQHVGGGGGGGRNGVKGNPHCCMLCLFCWWSAITPCCLCPEYHRHRRLLLAGWLVLGPERVGVDDAGGFGDGGLRAAERILRPHHPRGGVVPPGVQRTYSSVTLRIVYSMCRERVVGHV